MNHNSNIALIGGDRRQLYIAKFFFEKGVGIYSYANDAGYNKCCLLEEIMKKCDIIVLPVPAFKDNHFINNCHNVNVPTTDFLDCIIPDKHVIFGGCFNDKITRLFDEKKIRYYDFMKDDSVAWLNCIATAEGAILEAIKEGSCNIHASSCLITGYGRCAQVLADKIRGIKGNVTITCRKYEDMSKAKCMGYNVVPIESIKNTASDFDYIFNTVPAMLIDSSVINKLKKDCLIIDIASYPGGTDFDYARKCGIKAILALSIPGRVSPLSSGIILGECIEKHLSTH